MDGILIEDLNEQTSLAESDNLIVGGSDANKITVANVITALKNLGLLDGFGNKIFYATSSTAAGTAAKVATTTKDGFELTTGTTVRVLFTYANTGSSPTLNINDTGAISIKLYGTASPSTNMWPAGSIIDFVYTGTYWMIISKTYASTTYYGVTKLTDSVSSTSTSTAATPNSVKTAYDLANDKQDALTFDETPTEGSTNPVTSGGVYDALQNTSSGTDVLTVNDNYLYNSGNYSAGDDTCLLIYSSSYWSREVLDGYVRFTCTTTPTSSSRLFNFYLRGNTSTSDDMDSLTAGNTYTLSMRFRSSAVISRTRIYSYTGSAANTQVISLTIGNTADKWCDLETTFTANYALADFRFADYYSSALFAVGDTFDVAWIKLEESDTATMWIPGNSDNSSLVSLVLLGLSASIKNLESRVSTLEG